MIRWLSLAVVVITLSTIAVAASERTWQVGVWGDDTSALGRLGDTWQTVVIDGPDHLRYIAKRRVVTHGLKRHKRFELTVGDPVTFAVEDLVLYVRGVDPIEPEYEYRFDIIKRSRLP
jgi:hypothetical protein